MSSTDPTGEERRSTPPPPSGPGLGERAALLAFVAVFIALVVKSASVFGVNYEEVVPYVTVPVDIASRTQRTSEGVSIEWADRREQEGAATRRFVVAEQLPRLSVRVGEERLPVLNQLYMTNHLTLVGLALSRVVDPVWGTRLPHAAFGVVLLLLLYDAGRRLVSPHAALLATGLTACSLPFTFMYTWARFDESLASFTAVAVLAALLRYREDRRRRWLWVAAAAVGLGVSAKITTTWPLAGLVVAAAVARVDLRGLGRSMAVPLVVCALPLVPMVAFAFLAPNDAAGQEVGRRLSYIVDLFTTDVALKTAQNMVLYLGAWGSLLGRILRGPGGDHSPWLGGGVVVLVLVYLLASVTRPSPVPRRDRFATWALLFLAVIFVLIALFYREHRDYQFVLVVPLFSLALGAALDALARSVSERVESPRAGPAAALVLALVPAGGSLVDHLTFWRDIAHVQTPMFDLRAQRELASHCEREGVLHPISTTFFATGQLELLTRGRVRPLHAFPLLNRASSHTSERVFADLFDRAPDEPRWVILPVGHNEIESRHFDDPAIREAFLSAVAREEVGPATVEATFHNAAGEPLMELLRVPPRRAGFEPAPVEPDPEPPPESEPPAPPPPPVTPELVALLGGLAPGERIQALEVVAVTGPRDGAGLVTVRVGPGTGVLELRLRSGEVSTPAHAGALAVYYRRSGSLPDAALVEAAAALASRLGSPSEEDVRRAGLLPLSR